MSSGAFGFEVVDAIVDTLHHCRACYDCGAPATKYLPPSSDYKPADSWRPEVIRCDGHASVLFVDLPIGPAIRKLQRLLALAKERPSVRAMPTGGKS